MSLSKDKTQELWQSFMTRRKGIMNSLDTGFFSMQVYDKSLNLNEFNPNTEFEKWAAIEVSDFDNIPVEMESYNLKGGLYAVFIHKGLASTFPKTWQFIFNSWLPKSNYDLDKREHFEILDENYNPSNPNSKEEVWIPINE